jgi:ABC-type multidrug transport system fused ATPase/permease subunit
VLAALYIVFAPGFLIAWGMGNEGSYPDVLVLGTLMLALGFRFLKDEVDGVTVAFWIGVLGGFAFWIHILATYYLLAAAGILLVHRFGKSALSRLSAFALGFAVGDFPGILWNLSHEFQSFRWWGVDSAAPGETVSRLSRTVTQLADVFRTSFAVLAGYWPKSDPPPPEILFRLGLLILFPLSFGVFAYRHRAKLRLLARGRLPPEAASLGFAILVVLVFAQSSFGWMTDEPRYLLFLFSVLPLFVATAFSSLFRLSRVAAFAAASAVLFVSLRGAVLYFASARESDQTNREFLRRLDELQIRHVHSDYHLSYKYVFLSHGRMVWTSELGPSRTEWYFPFREEVNAASDAALVPRSFRFARRIEKRLAERGIRYRREDLLYPVLFDFSEKVSPSSLSP